jgi:hypothetical protein
MPRFDLDTLLPGVSGATYIGFKTTEAQPRTNGPATSGDTAVEASKSAFSTGTPTLKSLHRSI